MTGGAGGDLTQAWKITIKLSGEIDLTMSPSMAYHQTEALIIHKILWNHHMLKIFPFYNPAFDFNKSITNEVIHAVFENSLSGLDTTLDKLSENPNKTLIADKYHADDLINILILVIDEIERRLKFKTNESLSSVFNYITSSMAEQDQDHRLFEIVHAFNEAKHSVLAGKEPEQATINIIENGILGEGERCVDICTHLLSIYTLDTNTIKRYFVSLKQNNMSPVLTDCFKHIGVAGIRNLANTTIEKHLDDYDSATVSDIREYSQLFSLFVSTLNDIPVHDGNVSTKGLILSLMKAAYYDGQITKEREFYSDESVKVMASIGTSRAMKTSAAHSAKEKLLNETREEVRRLYKSRKGLSYSEMVKEVYKNEKFSSVKHYAVYRMVKEEAESLGLGRRKDKKNNTNIPGSIL